MCTLVVLPMRASIVFVDELRYTNICFGAHIGRNLGNLQFQAIATTKTRFSALDIIEIDSSFVCVADL